MWSYRKHGPLPGQIGTGFRRPIPCKPTRSRPPNPPAGKALGKPALAHRGPSLLTVRLFRPRAGGGKALRRMTRPVASITTATTRPPCHTTASSGMVGSMQLRTTGQHRVEGVGRVNEVVTVQSGVHGGLLSAGVAVFAGQVFGYGDGDVQGDGDDGGCHVRGSSGQQRRGGRGPFSVPCRCSGRALDRRLRQFLEADDAAEALHRDSRGKTRHNALDVAAVPAWASTSAP